MRIFRYAHWAGTRPAPTLFVKYFLNMKSISKLFLTLAILFIASNTNIFAQQTAPKVTKVDDVSIKEILKPNGKPLLVNFWATWCVPCREEFPDLVKINKEYEGKIDFITISLDDLAEINRDVPKFLTQMQATMPAYLLKAKDENAVISSISKDWEGGLPFTILYDAKGGVAHTRQGKIKLDVVRSKIDLLTNLENIKNSIQKEESLSSIPSQQESAFSLNFDGIEDIYGKGKSDAEKDIAANKLFYIKVGLNNPIKALWSKNLRRDYKIFTIGMGCVINNEQSKYISGYNDVTTREIERRYGGGILNKLYQEAKDQWQTKVDK